MADGRIRIVCAEVDGDAAVLTAAIEKLSASFGGSALIGRAAVPIEQIAAPVTVPGRPAIAAAAEGPPVKVEPSKARAGKAATQSRRSRGTTASNDQVGEPLVVRGSVGRERRGRILADLMEHGESGCREIAERLGLDATHVSQACHKLLALGEVILVSRGRFAAAEVGDE